MKFPSKVMVCGAISVTGKSRLHFIDGMVTEYYHLVSFLIIILTYVIFGPTSACYIQYELLHMCTLKITYRISSPSQSIKLLRNLFTNIILFYPFFDQNISLGMVHIYFLTPTKLRHTYLCFLGTVQLG